MAILADGFCILPDGENTEACTFSGGAEHRVPHLRSVNNLFLFDRHDEISDRLWNVPENRRSILFSA